MKNPTVVTTVFGLIAVCFAVVGASDRVVTSGVSPQLTKPTLAKMGDLDKDQTLFKDGILDKENGLFKDGLLNKDNGLFKDGLLGVGSL